MRDDPGTVPDDPPSASPWNTLKSNYSHGAATGYPHAEGEVVRDLTQDFGISEQRVSQIIYGRRK